MKRTAIAGPLVLAASAALADWSPDFPVTANPSLPFTEIDGGRNVIVDDDFVMVVWSDLRDGNPEIWFRERIDGVWSESVRLTMNAAASMHPAIGRFPGEVRVAFQDDRTGHPEIWMKRKLSGIWGADSCVTCDGFESARPSLDHTGTHLVWEETKDGNREIYYRERDTSGAWQPEFRISDDPGASSHPAVSSPEGTLFQPSGSAVLVVWQDDRDGNLEIYSRHRDEFYFPAWTDEIRVSHDPSSSRFPSGTVEWGCSDAVFTDPWVAWQDDRHGNDEIYLARGFTGTSWSSTERLSQTETPSRHPSVSSSRHLVVDPFGPVLCPFPAIAWEERAANGDPAALRFVVFADVIPETTITDVPARAANPSLAIDHRWEPGNVGVRKSVVVWEDTRTGPEIYFSELDGEFAVTAAPVTPPPPTALRLEPARPNPFRASTELTVRLEVPTGIEVRIVDAAGREVTSLHRGPLPAGAHTFVWNGEGAAGTPVTAGTYFAVVTDAAGTVARPVVRLR